MHIRGVSEAGPRLIYILMQENTSCNTNEPCVTPSYTLPGFHQAVQGCRLATTLALPIKRRRDVYSFHRPRQLLTNEDERRAQLQTCLAQNSCGSALPGASFASPSQQPKDIICGPARHSPSTRGDLKQIHCSSTFSLNSTQPSWSAQEGHQVIRSP